MLQRSDGTEFTTGRASYFDQGSGEEASAKIHVRISVAGIDGVIHAQLDTGAAWTMLDADVADAMALLDGQGERKTILTRFGPVDGRLERTELEITAEDGDSLSINATVWVSPEWREGTFLGYGGLLERIRFA